MSRLDELIEEYCADGVEYREIGSFAKNENARNKDYHCSIAYSITKGGLVPTSEYFKEAKITSDDTSAYKLVKRNWFVYSPSRIDVGSINYLKGIDEVIVSPLNVVFSVDMQQINIDYLLYFLSSRSGTWQILQSRQGIEGTGRKLLPFEKFAKIRVPVPPLPVQLEIVRILDNFTELTAELTTELTARKKQYEYYSKLRFEMLEKEYPSVPISKFGKWSGGKTPSMAEKRFWENGSIPWISSKDMKASILRDTEDHIAECALKDASMTLYPENCIAIVTRSGILKHSFPIAFIPFETTVNQDIKILVPNDNVIPKYIFFAMKAYAEDIRTKAKKQGGTVDSLEFQKVMDFEIPFPTTEEQAKIVHTLDRFDSLCNDLSFGLPAEIAARQKQYEYYRDKLLSFQERGA